MPIYAIDSLASMENIRLTRMKLHSKLQICHQGTQTQRDDVYFNLGALVSLWLNEKHQSSFSDQTGRSRPAAALVCNGI